MTALSPRNILVCSDGSPPAIRACEIAVELAAHHNARVTVLKVVTLHDNDPDAKSADHWPRIQKHAASLGVDLREDTQRDLDPLPSIFQAISDDPPDLVVMGNRSQDVVRRLFLGSTTLEVLRHGMTPMLIVDEDTPVPSDGTFRRLLVPVDFSAFSKAALKTAVDYASKNGAEIDVVHAIDTTMVPPYFPDSWVDEFREHAHKHLREFLADVPETLTVQESISHGAAPRVVHEHAQARDADLIVVGSSGLGAVGRLLVGSVTERILRKTDRAVLVLNKDPGMEDDSD